MRRKMQMIFQDPHAALNPAMTIGQSIADPLIIHESAEPNEARTTALRMMTEVGLAPAEQLYGKYPADLSGGQKQRAVIARAMILNPELIVADEPVAMLDMSIRAKILELLLDLRRRCHGRDGNDADAGADQPRRAPPGSGAGGVPRPRLGVRERAGLTRARHTLVTLFSRFRCGGCHPSGRKRLYPAQTRPEASRA